MDAQGYGLRLSSPKPPRRHRGTLYATLFALSALLAGCAAATVGPENTIQGRWHRLAEPITEDPFQTFATEYFEFRPGGVLASLLFDQGPRLMWTTGTGQHILSGAGQTTINGKCRQGRRCYEPYARRAIAEQGLQRCLVSSCQLSKGTKLSSRTSHCVPFVESGECMNHTRWPSSMRAPCVRWGMTDMRWRRTPSRFSP